MLSKKDFMDAVYYITGLLRSSVTKKLANVFYFSVLAIMFTVIQLQLSVEQFE